MKNSHYHIGIILVFVFLACLFGCAGGDVKKTQEKIDLEVAMDFQKAGRYDLALERFQSIRNKYPLSPEAVEAELQIAETYYLAENYIEALAYFKTFRDLHPSHKQVDFAAYRIALCNYKQIPPTIDRDLTPAQKALETFQEFLDEFPHSKYAKEIKEKQKSANQQLAEKEMYIAEFYLKRKKYQAAAGRLEEILKKYRNLGFDEKALYYQGLCYYHMDKKNQATRVLNSFLSRFPESQFAGQAKELLSK
ncbi:MAG: hypothetical protein A3B70_08075 [Deltaproteobacteria bacterium RIFCSPHIGHO2_02_FULL_40_11]|nr:MAG: hypothetical protein A3B70_08075 [Deltaproteobacteria bacterium RIFCSPHIGHO2_02_FULL_40_11]